MSPLAEIEREIANVTAECVTSHCLAAALASEHGIELDRICTLHPVLAGRYGGDPTEDELNAGGKEWFQFLRSLPPQVRGITIRINRQTSRLVLLKAKAIRLAFDAGMDVAALAAKYELDDDDVLNVLASRVDEF